LTSSSRSGEKTVTIGRNPAASARSIAAPSIVNLDPSARLVDDMNSCPIPRSSLTEIRHLA